MQIESSVEATQWRMRGGGEMDRTTFASYHRIEAPSCGRVLRIVSDTSCGLLTSIMPIVTLGRLGSSSIGSYLTLGMVGQLIVTFFDIMF